jgi:hypothetical protein
MSEKNFLVEADCDKQILELEATLGSEEKVRR